MPKPEVLIIGAGTGGLCLAHGLQAAGIPFRVFERDHTATDRTAGYRLTINANGARALQSCLPKENFERYISAAAKISTGVTFLDHKLRPLLEIDLPETKQSAPYAPRPIGRVALRKILLEGVEESVAFGKAFECFEMTSGGRVIARFEDGSSAEGDVLVGADGASSRVRRELLPQAQRVDTGLVAVSGKRPLDAAVRGQTPAAIFKGPTLILGPRGGFMFAGAVEYPPGRSSVDDPDVSAGAGSFYDRSEYVMWGFSIRRETLGLAATIDEAPAASVKEAVLAQVDDWSPDIRRLVERTEPSLLSAFAVKSSVPIDPWPTTRVTLLGDALHNMTPYRGIGANTALRDAALLRDTLRDVDSGRRELLPALGAYEREMVSYGFAAVRASLAQMKLLHTRSSLRRLGTKAFFRVLDAWPALGRRVIAQGSS
jgi:2-polyprenyl-6-methoxyphenol hydroxylase-like FAD-dependent oxidoreductase